MTHKPPDFGAILESNWPYVVSIGISTAAYFANGSILDLSQKGVLSVTPNTITILGVALAFVAAIEGVIVAISGNELFEKLRQIGVYEDLIGYFTKAIGWTMAALVFSFLMSVLNQSSPTVMKYFTITTLAWVFLVSMAGSTCLRVTLIFGQILRNVR